MTATPAELKSMRGLYLRALERHGRAIARAVEEAPAAPVPSCPGWALRDLGLHVAVVANMWAENVRRGVPDPPPYGLDRPDDRALGAFVHAHVDALVDVLRQARDDSPAWNWWGDPTARWIPRRAAHETGIHAWDAANALGRPIEFPADLAADGIVEFFDVMMPFTGHAPGGLDGVLRLEATDAAAAWLVDLDDTALPALRHGDEPGAVTLRGRAFDLLLVLWRRRRLDTIDVVGDRTLAERFLAYPKLG